MTFSNKNIMSAHHSHLFTGIKYLSVFFLGMSAVMLMTQAFTITTSLNNAVQYIQQIVLTDDGSATGNPLITLDGNNGTILSSGDILSSGNISSAGNILSSGNISATSDISSSTATISYRVAINTGHVGDYNLNIYGSIKSETSGGSPNGIIYTHNPFYQSWIGKFKDHEDNGNKNYGMIIHNISTSYPGAGLLVVMTGSNSTAAIFSGGNVFISNGLLVPSKYPNYASLPTCNSSLEGSIAYISLSGGYYCSCRLDTRTDLLSPLGQQTSCPGSS